MSLLGHSGRHQLVVRTLDLVQLLLHLQVVVDQRRLPKLHLPHLLPELHRLVHLCLCLPARVHSLARP